ncbi:arginase-1-like isoform X2 [Centruroides sculpturatus]|uniref:arginase-1-like isoform X2 n=1 Tax=Centruroides sculpturatus TaxID=218467 RepID=UPI000C6D82C1|nr:arginase-1-like isoform X2 [Centruroides sculpturatus]
MEKRFLRKYPSSIICSMFAQRKSNQILFKNFQKIHNLYKVNFITSDCSRETGNVKHKLNIGVIGMPIAEGQNKMGVEEGPTVLRKFGLIDKLKLLGHDVKDYGNVEVDRNKNVDAFIKNKTANAEFVGTANKRLAEKVNKIIQDGKKCLTLGGDHSLAVGSILGHHHSKPNIGVLFVDAHADINTPETSYSGHIHGMPVAFIIKEMQKYIGTFPGFDWIKSCISKNKFVYIALRDVDPLERRFLQNLSIKYYTMREVDKLGIYNVICMALENINPHGNVPLHVSFDIDALDKAIVPCTGTPVSGGLTLREAVVIAEEVAKTVGLKTGSQNLDLTQF